METNSPSLVIVSSSDEPIAQELILAACEILRGNRHKVNSEISINRLSILFNDDLKNIYSGLK
jgi:hypothetical protein